MPRLIHLNGPPGIGKSTLARLYVDDHPMVLNLDIDQVRSLVGGWRADIRQAGTLGRLIALAMAATHLQSGHDVVMPQYLGLEGEIERFAAVARDATAEFVEIFLMDTRQRSVERFYHRGTADPLPWHDEVRAHVEQAGGRVTLAAMYDQLSDVLDRRTGSIVVDSVDGQVAQTYQAICAVLSTRPTG